VCCRQTELNLTLTEPSTSNRGAPISSSGAYLGEIQLTVGLTPKSQEDKDQVGIRLLINLITIAREENIIIARLSIIPSSS